MPACARFLLLLVTLFAIPCSVFAAKGEGGLYKGRTVTSVIDEFRARGFGFAYSTSIVSDELRVTVEPTATDELNIVEQILAPHNLTIRSEEGLWLIRKRPSRL
jgi:hypothetical protein